MRFNAPILSLDIFGIDRSKNVIAYKNVDNYINLNFKFDNIMKKQTKKYTFEKDINKIDFDTEIMVFRIDMKNTSITDLFLTLSDLTFDLRVSYYLSIHRH